MHAIRAVLGKLVTVNQDTYPGLGIYWIQIRDTTNSSIILARVYADTTEELYKRAEKVLKGFNN